MEGKINAALDETLNMRFIYKVISGRSIIYGYLFVFVFVLFADKVMFDLPRFYFCVLNVFNKITN